MKKLLITFATITGLGLGAILLATLLTGCAASLHGDKHQDAQVEALKARANRDIARANALAKMAEGMGPEGRGMLAMALAMQRDDHSWGIGTWDSPVEDLGSWLHNVVTGTIGWRLGDAATKQPTNYYKDREFISDTYKEMAIPYPVGE